MAGACTNDRAWQTEQHFKWLLIRADHTIAERLDSIEQGAIQLIYGLVLCLTG